ncbi:MAG: MmgE/PrpD family protein [Phycisphaerales bacterium]
MAGPADMNKKSLARVLAEWATALRYEDLSKEAVEAAKRFWLDSLGCALGGSGQSDAHILLAHHREMAGSTQGQGPCTCFVSGFRTNAVDAAFVNGHMIRAMDYNDIYWKADPCHPSDIIAGPLALCEMKGGSGKDLILATVIAYEVEMRLCEMGVPGIREYGWHHATLTAFAAPIAAGRVLGLGVEQMVQAIGISASRGCALGAVTTGPLTNMKNAVDPWAGRMGVESALLAARGFTGPEHILDGKEGLFQVLGHTHHNGKHAAFDQRRVVEGLPRGKGDQYKVKDCGMKSFPIEALSHAPLTAMLRVVKENKIKPGDVEEILVEVIMRAASNVGDASKYRPTSRETADHSLPYCIAVGLVDGMVTPMQFVAERVMDKGLHPLMDRVKVVANVEFDQLFPAFQPSRVTIRTRGGGKFSTRVDVPKGDPRDPMTAEEMAGKFNGLGKDVVGEARCAELRVCVTGLEKEAKVDRLLRLMTK